MSASRNATTNERSVERILDAVRSIPEGRVSTFGDISPAAPRSVGRVLSTTTEDVPWHRVVRADGTVPKGSTQLARLAAEGVPTRDGRVDLARTRWIPQPKTDAITALEIRA
jgi:alkylated DNA nucleotide flippase Atl1